MRIEWASQDLMFLGGAKGSTLLAMDFPGIQFIRGSSLNSFQILVIVTYSLTFFAANEAQFVNLMAFKIHQIVSYCDFAKAKIY
jgi:hypothetical protein